MADNQKQRGPFFRGQQLFC
ncbi:hypothetical protein CCACVL1_29835 [Corchorus capsularis]|uniref:Uncharacterized protein n=1 Tax=Corchorus capsularis TaxID=210143 RepID=A0A1R3FZU7_COCAP|nr:hypothetical protein CCACVL1_29835 [Corchorus capsularis]